MQEKRNNQQDGNEVRFGFISYVSRSGSTLLSRLLNQHPDVCVCTEAHLPKELFSLGIYQGMSFHSSGAVEEYLRQVAGYSKLSSWQLDPDEVVRRAEMRGFPLSGEDLLRTLILAYRAKYSSGARVALYKGPPAMPWDFPSVVKAFPDFDCIHLLRDPRAVYASQKNSINPYSKEAFVQDELETAQQWRNAVLAAREIDTPRYLELRYEDLIEKPDVAMSRVCEHLGIPFDSEYFSSQDSSEFSSRLPSSESKLHSRIDSPPDRSRIEAWKEVLSTSEARSIEIVLDALLLEKGYERESARSGFLRAAYEIRIFGRKMSRLLGRFCRLGIGLLRFDRRYWGKVRGLFGISNSG